MRVLFCLAVAACRRDAADTTGDTADTSGSLPNGPGAFRVTVEGEAYDLELGDEIELTEEPLGILSVVGVRVEPSVTFALGVFDDAPLDEGTYDLGQWGGPAEQTEVQVFLVQGGATRQYTTDPLAATPGSLTIDDIDRTNQEISLSFEGELQLFVNGDPQGTATVSGTLVEQPYIVP